jgi:hypothetical protein
MAEQRARVGDRRQCIVQGGCGYSMLALMGYRELDSRECILVNNKCRRDLCDIRAEVGTC